MNHVSVCLFNRSLQNFHYKCDCSIVWFLRKLKQRKYRNRFLNLSNIGRCVYPKKLRSKRPLDLTEEDVCPLLPKKGNYIKRLMSLLI